MLDVRRCLWAVLGAMAALAAGAQAEETSVWNAVDELRARSAAQDAEIARLRAALAESETAHASGCCEAAGACCGSCCPSCSCCAIGPCCGCGWYAVGEAVWIEPRWKSLDALKVLTNATAVEQLPYEYEYEVSPRVWLGYMGCNGLGVRASWWQLDHDADSILRTVGLNQALIGLGLGTENVGQTLSADQSLELETIDLEATHCWQLCDSRFLLAFGGRYVQADVSTRQELTTVAGAVLAGFEADSSFEGIGPTLALEFSRALACSCLSLRAGLRGTIAFGEQEDRAARRQSLGLGGFVTDRVTREADEALAIAELQIALEWTCGGWFVRGGWQAQYWDDVASIPTAFGGLPLQQNTRSDLALQGFGIAVGAQY